MDSSQPTPDVGTKLLFENDAVRVWDLCLEPGEATPVHRHETDYFYVVIGDGKLARVDEDGTQHAAKFMQDGEVQFRSIAAEAVHAARNVGDRPWRNIVVELKQTDSNSNRD